MWLDEVRLFSGVNNPQLALEQLLHLDSLSFSFLCPQETALTDSDSPHRHNTFTQDMRTNAKWEMTVIPQSVWLNTTPICHDHFKLSR